MAMAAYEYPDDELAYAADQIDVPEGFRVEIIEGELIVSPTPRTGHGLITSLLRDEIKAASPSDLLDVENVTLTLPETGQRYIPDLLVTSREVLARDELMVSAHEAVLVVEVTSPGNAQRDRVKKLRGYAQSRVPNYLLIDRDDKTTTLFTAPVDGIYRGDVRVPFGEKLSLPEPFSGEIDTSEFAL